MGGAVDPRAVVAMAEVQSAGNPNLVEVTRVPVGIGVDWVAGTGKCTGFLQKQASPARRWILRCFLLVEVKTSFFELAGRLAVSIESC